MSPQRLLQGGAVRRRARPAPEISPAAAQTGQQGGRGERRQRAEHADHRGVRHDLVERAPLVAVRREEHAAASRQPQRQGEEQGGGRRAQQQREAAALEEPPRRGRPGVGPVRRAAQGGERAWQVDPEGMRRGVLADVQALAAVVAEVGQVAEIPFTEVEAPLDGGKHRAESLAVAAGVADAGRMSPFADERERQLRGRRPTPSCGHGGPPPRRPCGRTRCRSTCRAPPGIPARGCCRP